MAVAMKNPKMGAFGKGKTMAKSMPGKGAKGSAKMVKSKKPAKTPMAKTIT